MKALKIIMLQFFIFFVAVFSYAQEKKINRNPLTLTQTSFEYLKKSEEKKAILRLDLKLASEHRAYAEIFDLRFENQNIKVTTPDVSPVEYLSDKYSKGKDKLFFQNSGTLRATVTSNTPLRGLQTAYLTYQACTDTYCLLPKDLKFEVDFPAPQGALKETPPKKALSLQERFLNLEKNSFLSLFFLFLFGLLTAFSPCVFPMIPITMGILGFTNTSSRKKGFFIGFSYSLGLSLTYALIGLVAALTGSFIGKALTNPYIVWSIFTFYILMGFALLGVFSVKTPDKFSNKFSRIQVTGVFGAFLAGAVAGIIASPCTGPAVAAILAYVAQTKDPYFGFLALFIYGMGIGTLFILMGVFYGEISEKIRPGKWMNIAKYILAALIFLGAFLFIRPHLSKSWSTLTGSHTEKAKEEGPWKTYSEELLSKAQETDSFVIIDFRADWCSACIELEEKIFTKDFFLKATEGFTLLKFDATKPTAAQEKQLNQFKVYGLPTVLFIDRNGQVDSDLTLTGYEEWEDLKERIKALKTSHNQTK